VLGVLEQFRLPQQIAASGCSAILGLVQGLWRTMDSNGGKMEDAGGLRRFVEEIMQMLQREKRIPFAHIGRITISSCSGGYHPAILTLARGGLQDHTHEMLLSDASYDLTDQPIPWLKAFAGHKLRSIYTKHLKTEHNAFKRLLRQNGMAFSKRYHPDAHIVLEPTFFTTPAFSMKRLYAGCGPTAKKFPIHLQPDILFFLAVLAQLR